MITPGETGERAWPSGGMVTPSSSATLAAISRCPSALGWIRSTLNVERLSGARLGPGVKQQRAVAAGSGASDVVGTLDAMAKCSSQWRRQRHERRDVRHGGQDDGDAVVGERGDQPIEFAHEPPTIKPGAEQDVVRADDGGDEIRLQGEGGRQLAAEGVAGAVTPYGEVDELELGQVPAEVFGEQRRPAP